MGEQHGIPLRFPFVSIFCVEVKNPFVSEKSAYVHLLAT
jgi:hypothetical protein